MVKLMRTHPNNPEVRKTTSICPAPIVRVNARCPRNDSAQMAIVVSLKELREVIKLGSLVAF